MDEKSLMGTELEKEIGKDKTKEIEKDKAKDEAEDEAERGILPLLYMAPMEGITGHVYRRAHHIAFGDIDRYYTPFLGNSGFSKKEQRDLDPENNAGMDVVPQILTNHGELFLEIAGRLSELGYEEVNLNIGCPSGTVTAKGRGAGFLRTPDKLQAFLEEIFETCPLKISVKTRLGYSDIAEWPRIWEILCAYPFTERIVHARLREDFYKAPAKMDAYGWAVEEALHKEEKRLADDIAAEERNLSCKKRVISGREICESLCYNGDILSLGNYKKFRDDFPETGRIMLGRGLIGNPGLAGEIKKGFSASVEQMTTFLDLLEEGYARDMDSDQNAIWRLVEMWSYLKNQFPEGDKLFKKIRKSKGLKEYHTIVHTALRELPR